MLSLVMKVLVLSTIGVYIAFAFIVIRQVAMMRNTLKTPLGPILNGLAVLHFILALLLFMVAFILL